MIRPTNKYAHILWVSIDTHSQDKSGCGREREKERHKSQFITFQRLLGGSVAETSQGALES